MPPCTSRVSDRWIWLAVYVSVCLPMGGRMCCGLADVHQKEATPSQIFLTQLGKVRVRSADPPLLSLSSPLGRCPSVGVWFIPSWPSHSTAHKCVCLARPALLTVLCAPACPQGRCAAHGQSAKAGHLHLPACVFPCLSGCVRLGVCVCVCFVFGWFVDCWMKPSVFGSHSRMGARERGSYVHTYMSHHDGCIPPPPPPPPSPLTHMNACVDRLVWGLLAGWL